MGAPLNGTAGGFYSGTEQEAFDFSHFFFEMHRFKGVLALVTMCIDSSYLVLSDGREGEGEMFCGSTWHLLEM